VKNEGSEDEDMGSLVVDLAHQEVPAPAPNLKLQHNDQQIVITGKKILI